MLTAKKTNQHLILLFQSEGEVMSFLFVYDNMVYMCIKQWFLEHSFTKYLSQYKTFIKKTKTNKEYT